MILKIFSYAILIAFSLIYLNTTFAQFNEFGDNCGTSNLAYGKLHIPTSTPADDQFLRALFIFVTFSDDDYPDNPYLNSIWPKSTIYDNGTRPINPYTKRHNIVSNSEKPSSIPFMQRYEQYTISDYFCQMSGGQLDFIGDEVYFKLPLTSSQYQQLGYKREQLNKEILLYVNQYLDVDFTRYDNWHKVGNNWIWGGDGEAEMIVIQFRKIPTSYEAEYWDLGGYIPGGEAHLFGILFPPSITIDGITITNNDGITATQGIYRTTRLELVLEHEISHHIFASEFEHPGFGSGHVSIGMMNESHGTSTYCMLPMERSMQGLGWLTPIIPSNESSQVFTLRDEFEYGDAIKVTIPSSSPTTEYFWITNHQKKSIYDGVSRGSNYCFQKNHYEQDPICEVGKGLYVFHESDRNSENNINGGPNGYRHFAFDLKSANGKWDWDSNKDTLVNDPINLGGNYWLQKILNMNPTTGINTYYKRYLFKISNEWIESAQLCSRDKCWNPPNYKITADFHGNGKDGFNMGSNEILSPYSNPSSNSCADPTINTGITVRLLSQDPLTGSMQVKVYFDDNLALTECPPSKPLRLKVTGSYVEPDVSFHPHLVWNPNIEPDFIGTGHYNIYRGATYSCDNEPTYTYLNNVSSNITEYTDNQVLLYTGRIGGLNCGNQRVTYSYKITAVDATSLESIKSDRDLIMGYMDPCLILGGSDSPTSNNEAPKDYSLSQNYPNPFNPATNISYSLPYDGFVSLIIYDMSGREIQTLVNEFKQTGKYIVSFNASQLSSGVYFYKIKSGSFEQVRRMILLK